MIALLLRQHLAHAAVVPFALASGAMLVVIPNEIAPVPLLCFAFVSWSTIPQRTDAFEASLPIPGREVVMARALAAIALALIPVATWLGLSLARGDETGVLARVLESALLSTLVILVPHLLGNGSPVVAWIGLAAVTAAVWMLAPALAMPLFALGVVAAFVRLWITIPDALQLAPDGRPEPKAKDLLFIDDKQVLRCAQDDSESARSGRQAVIRSVLSGNVMLFWAIVLALSVLGSDSAFIYFCIAVPVVAGTVRMRTRWMAALPWSHRERLLAIVLPAVVVTASCVAVGAALEPSVPFHGSLTRDGPLIRVDDDHVRSTTVSFDHWRRTVTGTEPVITAPWGEQAVADTATVFRMTLYNPWTWTPDNSPRFREWQFGRATAGVYGRTMTPEQYTGSITRLRRVKGDARTWLANAAFVLTLGLLILLVTELSYAHRRRPGSRTTDVLQWLVLLPLLALFAADATYSVRGGPVVFLLLRRALFELGTELPSNMVLAVVVAAVPVAAAYALLERQFRRSEPARTSVSS